MGECELSKATKVRYRIKCSVYNSVKGVLNTLKLHTLYIRNNW
jgi:hypothetical protein